MESGVKAGRAIASFFISPVGIITYFIIRDKRPKNAKTYLMISLVAIGLTVGGVIFNTVINKVNEEKK